MNYTTSTTIFKTFKSNSEFEGKFTNKKLEFKVIGKDNLKLYLNIDDVKYFDFYPNNSKVFFVCNGKVEIYKISDDYDNIEKISEIKDFCNNIIFASFNPFEENILVTISEKNDMKIWDIYQCDIKSCKALNNGNLLQRIEWESGKIMYSYNDELIIYDYNNNKIISKLKVNIDNQEFLFFNNNNIIKIDFEFENLGVKIFSIYENKEKFNFEKKGITNYIYLNNFDSLILFDKLNITIFRINKNDYTIKEIKKVQIQNNVNLFGYSFSKLSHNSISLNLELYNFRYNITNKLSLEVPIENDKVNSKFDINKLKKKITDFKELNLNLIENKSLNNYKKKYFNIKMIQDELIQIQNVDLLSRSIYVKKNINKIKNITDINSKYIEIIKLIIRDNTIKEIIEIYLSFIKDKEKELKEKFKDNFEEFKDEKETYSAFFNEKEFFNKFREKKKTEKVMVLNILENIIGLEKIDDDQKIDSFIKISNNIINEYTKNLCYNHPINEENNEELIYFNNKLMIIYEFKSLLEEFNNPNTQEKKNKLIDLINIYIYEFKKIKELINNNISVNFVSYLFICAICSDTQENFDENISIIINNNKDNFEYKMKNPPNKLDIEKIRKFLIQILNSKCLETAFKSIYGENEIYMFNNNEYNKYYVENYINFLPIKGYLYAVTDKFTLKCFLISLSPEIIAGQFLDDLLLLKYAGIIFTTLHEFGHIVVDHLYYMSNCSKTLNTPRNEKILECEGGIYFEYALFGDIYKGLNIRQGMFLLKEDNYKKTCQEFQNNFEILELENLTLSNNDEFYEEFKKCEKILNYKNLTKAILIKSKAGDNFQVPYITLRNDNNIGLCKKDFRVIIKY